MSFLGDDVTIWVIVAVLAVVLGIVIYISRTSARED